jgi:Fe2+ transport system protein FeoA
MSRAAPILPLSEAAIGKRFRLVKINGGHRLTRRLLALGLSLGTEFEPRS